MAAVAAVVVALVVGASVTWLVTDRHLSAERGSPDAQRTSEPTGGQLTGKAAVRRQDDVRRLLQQRSDAVMAKDRDAFLALVDPAAERFRKRQATVFDRLVRIPLASWEYDYSGEGPAMSGYNASLLPEGAFVARVVLRYTFEGSTSPVETQQFLTLVPRGGRWLIAGDRDNVQGAQSGVFGRDIWELGPVSVVHGRSSLVIGNASRKALRAYARHADRAVRDVDRVWDATWSRRPVVIVPRTQADMALVVGTPARGLDQIAAVTTGYSAAGPTNGDRVVINPAAWRELVAEGRRVVMTHEVTHLATRATTYGSVPIWMAEGFADYVAYEAVDIPVEVGAETVLRQVRNGRGPRELPGDTDFDPARGDIAPAYEASWLAARMIAESYGERRLVRLYVAMAADDDTTAERDIEDVLGITEKRLVREWRSFMSAAAA